MWGANDYGQLGNGNNKQQNTPIEITNEFPNNPDLTRAAISIGDRHSSLLTAKGQLYVWGYNAYGQLGTRNLGDKNTPINITDEFLMKNTIF